LFNRHDAVRPAFPLASKSVFPLPEGKTEGDIAGYHCWAEFLSRRDRWVPVDASEAWKNPAKRDSSLAGTTPTAFLTYGRDIRLSPDQKERSPELFYLSLTRRPMASR